MDGADSDKKKPFDPRKNNSGSKISHHKSLRNKPKDNDNKGDKTAEEKVTKDGNNSISDRKSSLNHQTQPKPKDRNNNQNRSRKNRNRSYNSSQSKPKANPTGQISENFFKKDFACNCGECNSKFKMSVGIIGILESVMLKLGSKPEITKGFICENFASQQAITKKSYHVIGKAADFKVPADKLAFIFNYLEGVGEVRGLGIDYDNQSIHIDTREKEPQKWATIRGEQEELTSALRQRYSLGDEIVAERKDFITA